VRSEEFTNVIEIEEKRNVLRIFLSQFSSPLIAMLLLACLISIFLGEIRDATLIFTIIFLSAIFGFAQEYRAEKAIEALKSLVPPKAIVLKGNEEVEVDARTLKKGDVVLLKEGFVVPADCRIVEGEIEVDESAFTGESRAVRKRKGDIALMSSTIYSGRAVAIVERVGIETELGKIAKTMHGIKEEDVFRKDVEKFTREIVVVTAVIIAITFILTVSSSGVVKALLFALSLAVAAIPEDLPAVLTVSLSLGARDMARRNALVRKLSVIEVLGRVNAICTDKTGTLTEGKLRVEGLWLVDKSKEKLAAAVCFYCNLAEKRNGRYVGDETDVALKEYFESAEKEFIKIKHIEPFSPEKKYMLAVGEVDGREVRLVKGAPEVVMEMCNIDENLRRAVEEKVRELCSRAYRVLGIAFDNNFIGLVYMRDSVRKGVKEAIEMCKKAGIRVAMITGDNPYTALAIARECGIESSRAITGEEIDRMSDDELKRVVKEGCNVFARVNPHHKLRILNIFKSLGYTVAMTGDGVNDSLALKRADIGIAMGIRGCDVAREASDIVLLDDNFASIKNAIEEGRRTINNMRKFINYLLSCNIAEVVVILSLSFIFYHPVLTAVQLLWINLITDGMPAVALAFDKAPRNILSMYFSSLVDRKLMKSIVKASALLSSMLLLVVVLMYGSDLKVLSTTLFTAFIIFELFRIAVIKKEHGESMLENKLLLLSILVSILLQLFVLYSPLSEFFDVTPLSLREWLSITCSLLAGFIFLALFKFR